MIDEFDDLIGVGDDVPFTRTIVKNDRYKDVYEKFINSEHRKELLDRKFYRHFEYIG